MRYYEILDHESANRVAAYTTESEALTFVQSMIDAYGPGVTETWGLLWMDDLDDDAGELIAEGPVLANRARVAHAPVA